MMKLATGPPLRPHTTTLLRVISNGTQLQLPHYDPSCWSHDTLNRANNCRGARMLGKPGLPGVGRSIGT